MNNKKLVWYWAVAVIVLLAIFITLFGYLAPIGRKYLYERRSAKIDREYAQRIADREEALRNDTVGGKTPEETIEMFIKALEEGNLEMARSLYSVEADQKYMISHEPEIVDYLIGTKRLFETGQKKCTENKYCSWVIENPDGDIRMSLEKNLYTQVWKFRF